jgi:hypothetical protein
MNAQTALLCGCGSPDFLGRGFCPVCARRQRLSREHFDGRREAVLIRDNRQCRVCGAFDPEELLVHHRRPGVDADALLITLCRPCHVRVHHIRRPPLVWFENQRLLLQLWEEINRGLPLQRPLALQAHGAPPEAPRHQILLFEATAPVLRLGRRRLVMLTQE